MQCLIDEPTRITPTSATVLDQIATNAPNFVKHVDVSPPVLTNDHCTISIDLDFIIPKEIAYVRIVWQYDKTDIEGFKNTLNYENFENAFQMKNIDKICINRTKTFFKIA